MAIEPPEPMITLLPMNCPGFCEKALKTPPAKRMMVPTHMAVRRPYRLEICSPTKAKSKEGK